MATPNLRSGLTAALLMGLTSLSAAQIVQHCPSTNVCYSLSVPESSASSGSGDIYLQIQAPTTYTWAALGQGDGMAGANMFIMYTDSSGQNVTVSPRLGTGHVMPQHDTAARIEVLEGSGVSNGMMTANVRCSNCDSWSGGSMDFSASSASWIYAYLAGSALDTDALDATIRQHQQASAFTWDLSAARSTTNANPFVASGTTSSDGTSTSGSGSVPASCTPIANAGSDTASASAGPSGAASTGTTSNTDNDGDGPGRPSWTYNNGNNGCPPWAGDHCNSNDKAKRQSNGCPAGYEPISASNSGSSGAGRFNPTSETIILAHAVLACLAFVALFPIGGIIVRVASFTGLVWVHAGIQALAYLLYIVAFGIGVRMATNMQYLTRAHPIIGIILFVVLLGQPVSGLLHHKLFKKYRARTLWSYAHIGIGRITVLLGIVNGGLGLQLGDATGSSVIAYAVIAAIVALTYIAAIFFGEVKRRRAASDSHVRSKEESNTPPRYSDSQEMHNVGSGPGKYR